MSKKQINLLIGKQRYPLTVSEEDEQAYRETERLINNTINKYINWYGGNADLNYENILSMAILELGYGYLQLKNQKEQE